MGKLNKSYIIWMVILALLYLIFKNTLFGAIFFSVVVMLIISIIIAKVIINGVNIKVDVEKKYVERGSKACFSIHTLNKTIFPSNKLYIKININNEFFDEHEECCINIPASIRGEDIICSDVKCDYVGNVNIEAVQLIIMDYLGLVRFKKNISNVASIIVMPMDINYTVPIENTFTESDEGEKKLNSLDSTEMKGIREYTEGDTLRRIHWKLSSKYDELMVKEFEMSAEVNTEILVDLVRDNYEILNDTVEVMYSLIKNMLEIISSGVTVNWYDKSKEDYIYYDINSVDDLGKLLEYIYNTQFSETLGMVYYSYYLKNDNMSEDKKIYITSKEDKQEGQIIGVYNDKVVLKCI